MLIFILMKPGIPLIKPFKLGLSCGFSPRINLAVCLFRGRPRPNVLSHLSLDSFILYIQWSAVLEACLRGRRWPGQQDNPHTWHLACVCQRVRFKTCDNVCHIKKLFEPVGDALSLQELHKSHALCGTRSRRD